jgi:hypothetical protein
MFLLLVLVFVNNLNGSFGLCYQSNLKDIWVFVTTPKDAPSKGICTEPVQFMSIDSKQI